MILAPALCLLVVGPSQADAALPGLLSADLAQVDPEPEFSTPQRGELLGRRVARVVVDGGGAAAANVREVFGIKAGEILTAGAVRLGIKRVYLTGPWADVRVYATASGDDGVKLQIVLVPDRIVGRVVIDAGAIPELRLRPALTIRPGDRFREARLEHEARALERAAASLGYPSATARFSVELEAGAEHRVAFTVDPGPPTRLARIIIRGEPGMTPSAARKLLGATVGAPYSRPLLERGVTRLVQALRARRHLDAQVSVERASFARGLDALELILRVDAGPRFRLRFVGNDALAKGEFLQQQINLQTLTSADDAALQRACSAIESIYARAGFARAAARAEVRPEGEERELRFVFDAGPRGVVEEIFVEGAKHRSGAELTDELWRYVRSESPRPGILARVDPGDIEDVLDGPRGDQDRKVWTDRDRLTWFPPREYGGGFSLVPTYLESPPYLERLFARAGSHLTDVYRKAGYLDVKVVGPEVIWVEGAEDGEAKVRLRYRIDEGEQLLVGTVALEGAPKIPIDELMKDAKLAPGAPLDLLFVEEQRVRIEARLRDRGYAFARVSERVERTEDVEPGGGRKANLIYAVTPGPEITLKSVRVRGNLRTREFVILDRAQLRAGDLFRASSFERARARLLRMGLFASVSLTLLDDQSNAQRRDVIIEVRERPRYSIEAGGGASLEDGPRAFSILEARNVFGFGLGARVRAQVNYPAVLYDLVYAADDESNPRKRIESLGHSPLETALLFTEGQLVVTGEMPRVYFLPFDARLHVDAIGLREIRPAFTLMKGSVLAGLDMAPWRGLRLEPQLEAETSDFDCPNNLVVGRSCGSQSTGLTRRQDAGQISQLSFRLLSSLDLRDDPFRPHSGVYTSLTTDFATGGGVLRGANQEEEAVVSNFVKVAGVVSGYVPLAPEATFALSFRGGNIFALGDEGNQYVPLYKRFYLGGTSSIRGFREDSILPVDDESWPANLRVPPGGATDGGPGSLGGSFFVNARTELRMKLAGELEFGTFIDAGQLALDVDNFDLAGFAMGAGFGVRYNTPVGPLAIDLGWKVIDGQRRLPVFSDIKRMNLHFAIGYF